MAYRFELDDTSVEHGLRRIARGQMRRAIAEIDGPGTSPGVTVHQVRKRTKKLRALLRLVRPVFGDYKTENAFLRAAAAALSTARDAVVLIETFDGLERASSNQLPRTVWTATRQGLACRQRDTASGDVIAARLVKFRRAMVEAAGRAKAWEIEKDGFDAVSGGLARTYEDARKAMAEARRAPSPEALHDWRKRVKDHWYHSRLLRPVRPDAMKPHCTAGLELSRLLGLHHDLSVLEAELAGEPKLYGAARGLNGLLALIEARRRELEPDAFGLGADLFARSPPDICREWGAWWDGWRKDRK